MGIFHYDQGIQIFHKGLSIKPQSETEDPTYLGFNFLFDFDPVHRGDDQLTHDALFADPNSGLDSAIQYLMDLGYKQKANMLSAFKENLRYINTTTPYYFQSIEGIPDLWKVDVNPESFNNFRGKDKILTINCLESLDMRITSLADMYRKATFDMQSMRELLPENLKHFTLILQVMEIRKFHKLKEFVKANDQRQVGNSNLSAQAEFSPKQTEFEMVSNNISVLQFKLSFCEFDFSESFPVDSVSHADPEMAKQKFKIKVGKISETNEYVSLLSFANNAKFNDAYSASNNEIQDNSSANIKTNSQADLTQIEDIKSKSNAYADNASKYGQLSTLVGGALNDLNKRLTNAPANLVSRGVNAVQQQVTGAALGNVYDNNISSVINKFVGQKDQIQTAGGNVYPPQDKPTPPTNLGNVYQ